MSAGFELDPRLGADTFALGSSGSSLVRLMDDARWPWIILVPRHAGITQFHHLPAADRAAVAEESHRLCALMEAERPGYRLNVAALGNVVEQLHVHHVLRRTGDPGWPGPVWGHGRREPYPPTTAEAVVERWRLSLRDLLVSA